MITTAKTQIAGTDMKAQRRDCTAAASASERAPCGRASSLSLSRLLLWAVLHMVASLGREKGSRSPGLYCLYSIIQADKRTSYPSPNWNIAEKIAAYRLKLPIHIHNIVWLFPISRRSKYSSNLKSIWWICILWRLK